MNDKELLELAAKAAGYEYTGDCYCRLSVGGGHYENFPWVPLTDDGDALRLSVKLHMILDPYAGAVAIPPGVVIATVNEGDESAATRRAIVRAAAAIGEGVK